ncbi:Neuroglobin [Toxocara canis]|uniref:Neuroglobin n=1 Tax=Toxocara canis TaxID=6265 RepID=A0A0B2URR4_TOXCA|nr:Neuroglobin [Toxocara canis]
MDVLTLMTDLDKSILRKSWATIAGQTERVSVAIFRMIFEQIPDARLMFVFTQNDPLNCAITAELKFHALRFMQAVETVMSHLDDPRCLGDFFDNLGKIHARQEERVGFKPHYWSVFKECALYQFRKVLARKNGILRQNRLVRAEVDAAIILWREVLQYMIWHIKVAMRTNAVVRRANRERIEKNHRDSCASSSSDRLMTSDMANSLRHRKRSIVVPECFLINALYANVILEEDT